MKRIAFALAALIAAPAFGQTPTPPSDTVAAVVAKGVKMSLMDMEFELSFKSDGTYGDLSGMGGKYRIDGKKLCLTPDAFGQEICSEYPDGKKTGDSFEIATDFGPITVTMK